ncbi:unnamed protein product [Ambrosiozyma monospora]|uniref:Unnamed protein product n=1 Tax=Ambrosiozyma monospora TaxID=43982 RepID=A0ACB5T159_AMBMO|nr:unnamed protein product [Ambrosiozyma monospora]
MPEQWVCKRITGMPGDIILIDPSKDTLSNLQLDGDEENLKLKELKTKEELENQKNFDQYVIIPEGHCWVTGDNLSHSIDSRTYSVLPLGLISGKLIYGWYIPSFFNFKQHYLRKMENADLDIDIDIDNEL